MYVRKSLYAALAMILSGCTDMTVMASSEAPKEPMSLSQMQELDTSDTTIETSTNPMRLAALRDTALRFGAQGGLAWRLEYFNENELPRRERQLDNAFDFRQLMLKNNRVMPPVIVEAHNRMDVGEDGRSLRLSASTYHIERQAHFVGNAPTWRDYLTSMTYKSPKMPSGGMLPKDSAERDAWRKWVAIGWEDGVQQAEAIIAANFNRLKRDYLGVIQYHQLRTKGMVSEPYVAAGASSVTGDGTNLAVDDQILRISELPSLKVDSKQWFAVPERATAWASQKPEPLR